jgi:cyclase
VEQAQRIFSLGIEKIALSSAVIQKPDLITQISDRVGAQSVIVVWMLKEIIIRVMKFIPIMVKKAINPLKFIEEAQKLGAGEIVINSIDRDGVMKGYDLDLIAKVREKISLPPF